jgi:muconolactone delta-isomerase
MKLFEIEVVRTYTTTIEVALPDEMTTSAVERITLGNNLGVSFGYTLNEEGFYHEIWDTLGEAELEQCNTEILSVKAKINQ